MMSTGMQGRHFGVVVIGLCSQEDFQSIFIRQPQVACPDEKLRQVPPLKINIEPETNGFLNRNLFCFQGFIFTFQVSFQTAKNRTCLFSNLIKHLREHSNLLLVVFKLFSFPFLGRKPRLNSKVPSNMY